MMYTIDIASQKFLDRYLEPVVDVSEELAYEINNQLPHSVKNPTEKDRVHIIIDIMPYDMINYKIRKENND